jgi:hypothetical protein
MVARPRSAPDRLFLLHASRQSPWSTETLLDSAFHVAMAPHAETVGIVEVASVALFVTALDSLVPFPSASKKIVA